MLAAVSGTILNAINPGPEILAGKTGVRPKLLLTSAVPFLVASLRRLLR
jgi:hypothetical protein